MPPIPQWIAMLRLSLMPTPKKSCHPQKCICIGGSRGYNNPIYGQFTGIYVEKREHETKFAALRG
jgi:hypothetical protein